MLLLTAENKKNLPALYSTESVPAEDKIVQVKFFHPCGRFTFYAVEFDGEDTFFGFCVSPLGPECDEWGYASLEEFKTVKGHLGLGIERDLHFRPTKFSEIRK